MSLAFPVPAPATTDASQLVTGTLDDARLSANVLLVQALLSATTTMPTEPRQIWQELPGRVLRVTDPWLLEGSVWDDDGAWYDSQSWE